MSLFLVNGTIVINSGVTITTFLLGQGGEDKQQSYTTVINSVRFGSEDDLSRFDAVRPAFFGRVVARSGLVRFGSVLGSGRFRNSVQFGSVRPFRFGFLFLPAVFAGPLPPTRPKPGGNWEDSDRGCSNNI